MWWSRASISLDWTECAVINRRSGERVWRLGPVLQQPHVSDSTACWVDLIESVQRCHRQLHSGATGRLYADGASCDVDMHIGAARVQSAWLCVPSLRISVANFMSAALVLLIESFVVGLQGPARRWLWRSRCRRRQLSPSTRPATSLARSRPSSSPRRCSLQPAPTGVSRLLLAGPSYS